MAKKRGRPRVPKRKQRTDQIRVMLRSDEKKAIERAAEILGVSTGHYVRTVVLKDAQRIIAQEEGGEQN